MINKCTAVILTYCLLPIKWYGDGAGNTVQENSNKSVFSLIRMC